MKQWMGQEWDQNQKVFGNKWKGTHNNPNPMGHSEGSSERKVHSYTGIPKKDRNISNKQLNPTPSKTWGRTTKAAQSK